MFKIELDLPNFAQKFKEMQSDLMLLLAASMQTNRAMMFDKEGADNGKTKWASLNPHFRSGMILNNTGVLRKSMGPQNDGIRPGRGKDGIVQIEGTRAVIGTRLTYARLMNDGTVNMPGGVMKPTRAKALKIPIASGKFMFRKSVKIPARKMDIITEDDKREWADTLANYIAEKLNG